MPDNSNSPEGAGIRKKRKKRRFRFKRPGGPSSSSSGRSSVRSRSKASKSITSTPTEASSSPSKKKGFGLGKIKKLVKGRRKGRGEDDENSLIDYDPHNPPKSSMAPRTALDPDILAQVVEDESFHSDSGHREGQGQDQDQDQGQGQGQRGGGGGGSRGSRGSRGRNGHDNNRPPNRMASKGPSIGTNDSSDYDDGRDPPHPLMDSNEDLSDEEGAELVSGPISLVLLLVDPQTFRFELLQLDFERPQEATVEAVLEQIRASISAPAMNSVAMNIVALVDRLGQEHKADDPLSKAMTQRKRRKDILVGLSKGMSADHCMRLARPILGDDKVIGMLQLNGYDVAGWAKDKKTVSALTDSKKKSFRNDSRKKHVYIAGIAVGTLLVLLAIWIVGQRIIILSGKPALPATITTNTNTNTVSMDDDILNAPNSGAKPQVMTTARAVGDDGDIIDLD